MSNPSHVEQRRFGRKNVNLEGAIELPLFPPLPCRVRELTAGGALLEVADARSLPNVFRVRIDAAGIEAKCHVRRREGTSLVGIDRKAQGSGLPFKILSGN